MSKVKQSGKIIKRNYKIDQSPEAKSKDTIFNERMTFHAAIIELDEEEKEFDIYQYRYNAIRLYDF